MRHAKPPRTPARSVQLEANAFLGGALCPVTMRPLRSADGKVMKHMVDIARRALSGGYDLL